MELILRMLFWGIGGIVLMMFFLWLLGLQIRNYAVVDVGWTIGLPVLATIYSMYSPAPLGRITLALAMTWIWGFRLGLYLLFTRIIGHPEEGRYQQLRKDWKTNIDLKFLAFFQFQGALDLILSLPFLVALLNPATNLQPIELVGAAIWAVALAGESVADAQLNAFKRDVANKGKTCRRGLWNYSRHPNYFFEWMIWVAWFVFALGSPHGYIALICPLVMLYFLFKLTGIPATEAQALRSKGDDYRQYQETTSAFVPWFKKASR